MAHQLSRSIYRLSKLASGILEKHILLLRHSLHSQVANVTQASRVLTTSSMMRQDGHYITELPIVMCRADPTMFPLLEPVVRKEKPETAQDIAFKLKLQECCNVQEVFELLEIPTDTVSGYAATHTLQRICQLPNREESRQSFLRTAILNELCETVTNEIVSLSNDTVISLVLCCSRLKNMGDVYKDRITDEVEKRVGQAAFSIDELCTLIEIISNDPHADQTVANNMWIHIGGRQKQIMADNIAHVYSCAKYFNRNYKYIMKLLSRQLSMHWWKLTNADVVTITNALTKFSKDFSVLRYFGKWMLLNIHAVTDTEMKAVMSLYLHFNYRDISLIKALEKYVPAKIDRMDITLIGMIQLYLRLQRHLSPVIMDTVAEHFAENGDCFEPFQILLAVKSFGELNYVPPPTISYKMFSTAERVLYNRFSDFNVDQMLQLLTSFAFVERFPRNFVKRVFNPNFISKINHLKEPMKERATTNLQYLYTSHILEKRTTPYVYYKGHRTKLHKKKSHQHVYHSRVYKILTEHIGEDFFLPSVTAGKSNHTIDFLVLLDGSDTAVQLRKDNEYIERENSQHFTKLAVLIQYPEFYCVNSQHLLGEYAMRNRQVALMGYDILELVYNPALKFHRRVEYAQSRIREHIHPPRKSSEFGLSNLIEEGDK